MLLQNFYIMRFWSSYYSKGDSSLYAMSTQMTRTTGEKHASTSGSNSFSASAHFIMFKTFLTNYVSQFYTQYKTTMSLDYNGVETLVFGTGRTKPQLTDYRLENEIDASRIECSSLRSVNCSSGLQYGFTGTYKNISNEPITVYEIGLLHLVANYTSSTSSVPTSPILLARDVLDEPFTIQPGEIKTVVYRIDFA